MKNLIRSAQVFAAFLILSGCGNLPSILSTPQPAPVTPASTSPTTTPANPPGIQVTPESTRRLRVWLPPMFDPEADSLAGELLRSRLDEFNQLHPDVLIEVRIKAERGPGNLFDTLTATNTAAPSLMPDLVALPRADLESATLKGLLHPLDGLTTLMEDPDWYPYARQMSRIQNSLYGIPFAGDAFILAGFSDFLPPSWVDLQEGQSFLFAAADPQALFSLGLYLSHGASLVDASGRPFLEEAALADVLAFIDRSIEAGFLSPTVNNYSTNALAWQAFQERKATIAIVWSSTPLNENLENLSVAPVPALDGSYFSMATGWSWALAGSDIESQPLAVELAEFLTESEFLSEFSQATGYLPTRPTALMSWRDVETRLVLEQVASSSQLIPSRDLLVTFGPLFQEAVNSVLIREKSPQEAAQFAVDQLK